MESTTNTNTKEKGWIKTTTDIFGLFDGKSSVHNCYGLGQTQCVNDGYRNEGDLIMNKEQNFYELTHPVTKSTENK